MTEHIEPDPGLAEERAHRRRLARSTAVFGAATALSRVLGLVREMVAAYAFGAAGKINAFTVAFQIPNLVRALVADTALSGAFVPVFSELLEKGERARAWRVASTIFWLVLLFTTGLTAVFVLAAPLIVELFGTPGGDFDLAVGLSRLLFPIVILLGLSGIVVGILNAYDQFTVPALTPVAWNLVIILGLVLGVPWADGEDAELYVYAGSIVARDARPAPDAGSLAARARRAAALALDWRDPAVRRFFVLMLPVTLTLGLINVSTLIGTLFASRLIDPDLAPRAIDLAFRLYMLPQGIFSVAVATVLFPTLSRLAARADMAAFGRTLDTGIRQIGFLLIPAGLVSAVLAEPITRLVYERGEFTPDQTPVVAGRARGVLRGPRVQRLDAAPQPRVLRAPVELDPDVRRARQPRAQRRAVRGVLLVRRLGPAARDVALESRRGGRAGGADARRVRGGVEPAATLTALARILVASGRRRRCRGAVWWGLDAALGRSRSRQVVSVGGALALGTGAYLLACRVLGVRELGSLLELRPRRRPDGGSTLPSRMRVMATCERPARTYVSPAASATSKRPLEALANEAPKQGFEGAPEAWIVFESDVADACTRPRGLATRCFVLTLAARGASETCNWCTRGTIRRVPVARCVQHTLVRIGPTRSDCIASGSSRWMARGLVCGISRRSTARRSSTSSRCCGGRPPTPDRGVAPGRLSPIIASEGGAAMSGIRHHAHPGRATTTPGGRCSTRIARTPERKRPPGASSAAVDDPNQCSSSSSSRRSRTPRRRTAASSSRASSTRFEEKHGPNLLEEVTE